MKYINKFNTPEEFETAKDKLNTFDYYVTYVIDENKVYLKLNQESIIIITTDGTSNSTFQERLENGQFTDYPIKDTLFTIKNAPYGFKITNRYVGTYMYDSSLLTIDLSKYDTSKVVDMSEMFQGCDLLTSLDLSNFDTSNVTNMANMFNNCDSLTSLDLSNFDTSNVTNMSEMFMNSGLEELNVSKFKTSQVKNMRFMFKGCRLLSSLDLSNFDTSNVTDMAFMFDNCESLTSLDLSNFDIRSITDMDGMFLSCDKLTHIKCKQAFKNWCITNQDKIKLPEAMREGGNTQWEIVN